MNKEPKLTRRNFLQMGIGTVSALALLEFSGASLAFMQPRPLAGEFGSIVNAGPVESFPVNSVTHFPHGRFYLVRLQDGDFLALYQRCTHLGCTVSWEANQNHFFCPCHASSFDQAGEVENPPAPRDLDTFAVTLKDGSVLVDTSNIQTRKA